jgi:hypothetical protein
MLFTSPLLGMVGKTEDELIKAGTKCWMSYDSWPMHGVSDRAHMECW